MVKQWQCSVCGYIHEGPEPPEHCPVCGADRSQFVLLDSAPAVKAAQVGRFTLLHPVLVHFPNGLMPVVWLFLLVAWSFERPALHEAVVWMVGVVTLATPLVLATGIYDWQTRFGGAKAPIFYRKIMLASGLLILGSIALLLRFYGEDGILYYICLAGMLGCVGLLGFYGGKLTFEIPPKV